MDDVFGLGTTDPTSADFYVRPDYFEVLARLRAEAPVHEFAPGMWCLTCYDDVRRVSSHPEQFCSGRGAIVNDPLRSAPSAQAGAPSILMMDPPEHGQHRHLVNRRFTPRAVGPMEPRVRELARSVLERAPAGEELDFVEELSAPFPLLVIAELLGIEEGDRSDFRRWSDATIETPDRTSDDTMTAMTEFFGFLQQHIADKRAAPGGDLVSLLVSSEVDGRSLTTGELFSFLLTLLVAGNETTRHLLTGGAVALSEHPDQRAALASAPEGLPGAVEECLRWVTPVHAFCRTPTEDLDVGGVPVAAGDYLVMLYASANRDESVFGPTADRFDVTRPVQPTHLAFGFGEHLCLGASLARLEARVFFEELLSRYPAYEVLGPPVRVPSTIVASVAELPVRLVP